VILLQICGLEHPVLHKLQLPMFVPSCSNGWMLSNSLCDFFSFFVCFDLLISARRGWSSEHFSGHSVDIPTARQHTKNGTTSSIYWTDKSLTKPLECPLIIIYRAHPESCRFGGDRCCRSIFAGPSLQAKSRKKEALRVPGCR
jgi:hypothetical protein